VPKPKAAILLGNAERRPALLGELLPEVCVIGILGLHQLANDGAGAGLGQEGAGRRAEHLLLFRESEIHIQAILVGGLE